MTRALPSAVQKMQEKVTRLEIGCGQNKRAGFFGIDIQNFPGVDLVLDVESQRLPFDDESIEYVYSSHTFEHLTNFPFVLQELFRVCRPEAVVEVWTPYGKSNDGLLFGHHTFFTETHFKHICFEYDRFYLGACRGYFEWQHTHYNLYPNIVARLRTLDIPFEFALEHMFNIALEWGVFLQVHKGFERAPGPQHPTAKYFYGRNNPVDVPKTRWPLETFKRRWVRTKER